MKYVIATRGERNCVRQFMEQLSGKWWPYRGRKHGDKKVKDFQFQTGVQPLQLWVINFPEKYEGHISATIFNKARTDSDDKKLYSKILWPLRKMLGLKTIDMDFDEKLAQPINKDWVQVLPIGKMESGYITIGDEEIEQL